MRPLNLSVNVLLGDLYSVRPSAIPSVTILQIEENRKPFVLRLRLIAGKNIYILTKFVRNYSLSIF